MAERKRGLFDRIVELNAEAFERREFDTAYHLLSAALHLAISDKDEMQIQLVQGLAADQIAEIDRTDPDYVHSTKSARARGHDSIYAILARQAVAREKMVRREHEKTVAA